MDGRLLLEGGDDVAMRLHLLLREALPARLRDFREDEGVEGAAPVGPHRRVAERPGDEGLPEEGALVGPSYRDDRVLEARLRAQVLERALRRRGDGPAVAPGEGQIGRASCRERVKRWW